jgi:hypothetical protein
MVFREKAKFLWSRLPRRVSLQSFCIQKRPHCRLRAKGAFSAQQGRDLCARQRSLMDRNAGIVLEREER